MHHKTSFSPLKRDSSHELMARPPMLFELVPTSMLSGESRFTSLHSSRLAPSYRSSPDDRLLFDGQRIADDQTAADLEMEEGDAIEVLLERTWFHLSLLRL